MFSFLSFFFLGEDYLGLSIWAPNIITNVLIRGRPRIIARRGNVTAESRCFAASFEDGSRTHKPRNTRNAVINAGKDKQTDFPLKLPQGGYPSPHVGFIPVKLILDL